MDPGAESSSGVEQTGPLPLVAPLLEPPDHLAYTKVVEITTGQQVFYWFRRPCRRLGEQLLLIF